MALITGFNGSLTGQASSTTSATEEIAAATRYLVEGAVDMGGATPALIEGKSYLSSTTGGGFTQNYIYVALGGSWIEVVPTEGIKVYDRATDTEYVVGADGSLGPGGTGTTTTVTDSLTSTSPTEALSANQGRVLAEAVAASGDVKSDGTVAMATDLDIGGNKAIQLADGTEDDDAATFGQVKAVNNRYVTELSLAAGVSNYTQIRITIPDAAGEWFGPMLIAIGLNDSRVYSLNLDRDGLNNNTYTLPPLSTSADGSSGTDNFDVIVNNINQRLDIRVRNGSASAQSLDFAITFFGRLASDFSVAVSTGTDATVYPEIPAGFLFGAGDPGAGDLLADGTVAMAADFDLGTNKLINLAAGTNPTDAVTKQQLDDGLSALGTVEHEAADIAARDALPAADLSIGDNVFVDDASGDATVEAGWALYRVTAVTPALGFLKIHEQEGLDVSVRTTIQAWQASNDYVAGQLAEQAHRVLKAKTAFTSAATFTVFEATNWVCVSQTSWTVWAPNTTYIEGELVRYENRLYRCSVTFTSAADFNIGNFPLEFNGENLADWAADTRYEVGQLAKRNSLVIQRAFQVPGGGVSESTFDVTEAARWVVLVQPLPAPNWAVNTLYVAGEQTNFGGLVYSRKTSGESGAAFNSADWDYVYPALSSGISAQLEKWDRSTSGEGHGFSEQFIDGTYYARLSGDSTTDFAFFGTQVSPDADRVVRLRVRKDTAATTNGVLRLGGSTGFTDFIFNPVNGTTAIDNSFIGADVNPVVLLSSTNKVDSFEWVVRFPQPNNAALDYFLILIPNHSPLATPTVPDVSLTGAIDVSLLDIDYDYTPDSAATATLIDSSLSTVTETLPSATGSGAVVFYTNKDVAINTASLVTQAGESLNGLTGVPFVFSHYSNGTQFRVDDVGVGQWVVSVAGAASTQERMLYSLRGISVFDMSAQSSGGVTTIDLDNMLPSVVADGGTFPVVEIDEMGVRSGNVITIPAGHGGTYRMGYSINHDDTDITGTGVAQSTTNTNRAGIRINGLSIQWLSFDDGTGLPDLFDRGPYTLIDFNEGDQIEVVINSDAAGGNEEWIVFFSLEEVDTSEVVLAGMVQATELASVVYTLSADASGVVCPFDQGQGDTTKITNTAGTITLPAGKHRIVPHATRSGAVLDYELYDVTNSTVLERYTNNGLSQLDAQGSTTPYYLTISAPTQIQIREGGGTDSVVWNGRETGIDAGHDDALYNYACWIDIQQISAASVVMPDALTPEDTSHGFFRVSGAQSSITSGDRIQFDVDELVSGVGISNDGTGLYTLAQGGLWEIESSVLRFTFGTPGAEANYRWYNVTDGEFIGGQGSSAGQSSSASNGSITRSGAKAKIDTTTGSKQVELRMLNTPTVATQLTSSFGNWASITQKPKKSVVAYSPDQVEARSLDYVSIYYTEAGTGYVGNVSTTFGSGYSVIDLQDSQLAIGGMSSWVNENTIIVPEDRSYRVNFSYNDTTTQSSWGLYVNGSKKTGTYSGNSTNGVNYSQQLILDLKKGDVLEIGSVSPSNGNSDIGSFSLVIEQRAAEEVVAPGDVPVEDVRVPLGAASNISSNSNVTISQAWGSLAAEYERVEFEFISTAGTLVIRNSETISTANWADGTRTVLNADDTTIVVRDMDIAGTTGNLFLSGSVSQGTINVYGLKSQKTVTSIKATDAEFFPPTDYTPVLHATTTNPALNTSTVILGTYSGVVGPNSGDKGMLEINIQYAQTVAGTSGDGTYFFDLPAGFTVDPAYIQAVATDPEDMRAWGILTHVTDNTSDTHQNGEIHLIQNTGGTASGMAMSAHDDSEGSLSRAYVDNTFYDVAVAVMEYKLFAKVPVVRV